VLQTAAPASSFYLSSISSSSCWNRRRANVINVENVMNVGMNVGNVVNGREQNKQQCANEAEEIPIH
jgi:hypothetical protein